MSPAVPPGKARVPKKKRFPRSRFVLIGVVACLLWAALEYLLLPSTANLARTTPAQSAFMRERLAQAAVEGHVLKIHHTEVPLSHIAPCMQRAVVLSEDARFWTHHGIDWQQLEDALRQSFAAGRIKRGASTITQQVARNLYLSDQRSLRRKLKEWILARRLENHLSKKRILELYLNFAEWGNGVFGIEAAARTWFGKSAAILDPAEAAVLTAMLPLPRKRDPFHPSRRFIQRAREVAALLVDAHEADSGIQTRLNAIFRLHGNDPEASIEEGE